MIEHQVDLVNVVAKECPVHNSSLQTAVDEETSSTVPESDFDFDDEAKKQEPVCICEAIENNISSSY